MPVNHERGATAIVVASTLFVLMGFAAFAVDISAAKNERRLDQGAVDAAVLAAGVEYLVGGGAEEAADAVREYTDRNLGRTVTDADWTGCNDPDALEDTAADLSLSAATQCISFEADDDGHAFARMRVRLPDQATETTFGRVLGVELLHTSAAAEIEVTSTLDVEVFPAGVEMGTGVGDRLCLSTGSEPAESCDEMSSELAAIDPGTCNDGIVEAMKDGFDELLGVYSDGGSSRGTCDGQAYPNTVTTSASLSANELHAGLVAGRLDGPSGAEITGEGIENVPLWTYIDTSKAIGPECADAADGPSTINDPDDSAFHEARVKLIPCLKIDPPTGLFSPDLYDSPRLVIMPVIETATSRVRGYVPAYIDSLWTEHVEDECTEAFWADPGGDFCRHDPGRTGSSSQPARSASVIVLSCDLLSEEGTVGDEKCKKIGTPPNEQTVFLEFSLSG